MGTFQSEENILAKESVAVTGSKYGRGFILLVVGLRCSHQPAQSPQKPLLRPSGKRTPTERTFPPTHTHTQATRGQGSCLCAYLTGGGPASRERVTISLRQTSPTCSHHFISNYKEGTNPLESTLGVKCRHTAKREEFHTRLRGGAGLVKQVLCQGRNVFLKLLQNVLMMSSDFN